MDGIEVVELGADHPIVAYRVLHAQARLQRARVCEVVGCCYKARISEWIRGRPRPRGRARDLIGGQDGQIIERVPVQINADGEQVPIYGRTQPRQRQRNVAWRQTEIVCRIGQQQHGRGCVEYAGMAANHGLVRRSRRVRETCTRHPLFKRIRSRCRIEVSAVEQRGGLNLVDHGSIVCHGLRILLTFPSKSIIQREAIRDAPRVLRIESDLVHMEISQPIANLQLVLHERIIETVRCRTA